MAEKKSLEKKDEQSKALQTEALGPEDTYVPQVDIIEKADCIQIMADMPGVPREDVDVTMEEGVLTIDGKAAPSHEVDLALESGEYGTGNFHRAFALGEGLDTGGIEAEMKDGVLRLTVPKSPQYKPRQIEIK